MTDLKSLRELAEKATEGPWETDAGNSILTAYTIPLDYDGMGMKIQIGEMGLTHTKDAEFIAALNPTVAIELIERIEKAEEALKEYQFLLQDTVILLADIEANPHHAAGKARQQRLLVSDTMLAIREALK